MSTPRSLRRAEGLRTLTLDSPFGPVAALRADAGPAGHAPVLLLPGFTGGKEDFLDLVPALAARGFDTVAVDQRGQYESPGVEDDDPPTYSLEAFAAEAVAIIETLASPVHLVGHSFGGLVAQAATLLRPELVGSLTLLCSGPGALPPEQHADLAAFTAGLPLAGKDAVWTVLRERKIASRGAASAEVEAFVRRRFVTSTTGSLVGMARILCSAPDRVDELATTGVPVHVVHGEHDDAWPAATQHAMAVRLAAAYRVIPNAGHSPNVDDAGTTAEVLAGFFSSAETTAAERFRAAAQHTPSERPQE